MDYPSNLAFFLLDKVGSVCGIWKGKLSALEQRCLFGKVLGKGTIIIDGEKEVVFNRVKVCFGQDCDDRNITSWKSLT